MRPEESDAKKVEFAALLRQLMSLSGLTADDVAAHLAVSGDAVYNWTRGNGDNIVPAAPRLYELCRLLDPTDSGPGRELLRLSGRISSGLMDFSVAQVYGRVDQPHEQRVSARRREEPPTAGVVFDWTAGVDATQHTDGEFYSTRELLSVGGRGRMGTFKLPRIDSSRMEVEVDFEIEDDYGDPSRWFGLVVGDPTSPIAHRDTLLVRTNGNLEIVAPTSARAETLAIANRKLIQTQLKLLAAWSVGRVLATLTSGPAIPLMSATPAFERQHPQSCLVAFGCRVRLDRVVCRTWAEAEDAGLGV